MFDDGAGTDGNRVGRGPRRDDRLVQADGRTDPGQIRTRPGVPQTYIRRKVLNSWSLNEALRAVLDVDRARPNHLLLTRRDGFVIDVETTPDRHGWSYPRDGVLAHANH